MFLVGLTGGIGSGKSTVSNILQELGCRVVDADQIAREVVKPGKPAWKQIRKQFGDEVFHGDGTLNRERLGEIIFENANKRALLNSITHPQIYKEIIYQLLWYLLKGEQFVILDLPLLFETSKMLPYLNTVVVVYCDLVTQIERLRSRNQLDTAAAVKRIDAQLSLDEKCRRATHIIRNTGTLDALRSEVLLLHERLRTSRAHWKVRLIALGLAIAVVGSLIFAYRTLHFW